MIATKVFHLTPSLNVRLEWKAQDLWIGAYWHCFRTGYGFLVGVDAWICLIPTLPLHFQWTRRDD